jgi:hypothetical protein
MDYTPILLKALAYANSDGRKPASLTFAMPIRTDKLELWYQPEELRSSLFYTAKSEDEVIEILTKIVTDAVQRAIVEYGDYFASEIIKQARNGDAFTSGNNN